MKTASDPKAALWRCRGEDEEGEEDVEDHHLHHPHVSIIPTSRVCSSAPISAVADSRALDIDGVVSVDRSADAELA